MHEKTSKKTPMMKSNPNSNLVMDMDCKAGCERQKEYCICCNQNAIMSHGCSRDILQLRIGDWSLLYGNVIKRQLY